MKLIFKLNSARKINCHECHYYVAPLDPRHNPGDCTLVTQNRSTKLKERYSGNCYAYRMIRKL